MSTDYAALFNSQKMLGSTPQWFFSGGPDPLYTITAPLEVDYVTIEGLLLIGHCRTNIAERDVTLSLVYKPAVGLSGPLSRYDWNPFHDHTNHGLIQGQWSRKVITCATHLHPFNLNFSLGWERMVKDNLPIAVPAAENPPNFREMLAIVGTIFGIADIQRIPLPEWSEPLL